MRSAFLISLALLGCSTGSSGVGDDDDDDEPAADAAAAKDGPSSAIDAGVSIDAASTPDGPGIGELCFSGLGDPNQPRPNYDQFNPTVGTHCAGTNHQAITGIEKVVFLGDSITEGTPPTLPTQYYREVLAWRLRQAWGFGLEVTECSAWGARADDLLMPPHQQIHDCFASPEPKRTLVIMTIGGNDMSSFLEDAQGGDTPAQTIARVDEMLAMLDDAVRYLKDPVNFPSGSHVVFTNIYEFTDATGDLESCPGAALAGFSGEAAALMRPAYVHANEQYMRIAVERDVDLVFSLENFCGHGFHADDPQSECYRGPGTPTWFDLTCIHPNPAGHTALADLFYRTIME